MNNFSFLLFMLMGCFFVSSCDRSVSSSPDLEREIIQNGKEVFYVNRKLKIRQKIGDRNMKITERQIEWVKGKVFVFGDDDGFYDFSNEK